MLRAGIFLDLENLVRCGGWGVRFRRIRELVEAQGAVVVRANAYMAIDRQREQEDEEYSRKKADYRDAVRREGFHLRLKEIQHYRDEAGEEYTRADVDLELAVEAMQQSESLDLVMVGSGDGNLVRLVEALQDRGKRVDLLSFSRASSRLRRAVDHHFSGYLFPGILPTSKEETERMRGVMHHVIEDKGFGFLTVQTGLAPGERRDDVFLHINDYVDAEGYPVTNEEFAMLRVHQTVIEFELKEQEQGRFKAEKASGFQEPEW